MCYLTDVILKYKQEKIKYMDSFFEKVYKVVEQIPKGKVATYGQIALLTGNPRMSKFVGFALHSNPYPGAGEFLEANAQNRSKLLKNNRRDQISEINEKYNRRVVPCHRVVNRLGEVSDSFAFGGKDVQKNLLMSEGVKFNKDNRIDLDIYLWKPNI